MSGAVCAIVHQLSDTSGLLRAQWHEDYGTSLGGLEHEATAV